jgi:hypothetical protein
MAIPTSCHIHCPTADALPLLVAGTGLPTFGRYVPQEGVKKVKFTLCFIYYALRHDQVMAAYVRRMGKKRKPYRTLVQKPEGNRPLARPRHRWEDKINMDLKETGLGGMNWIDLAQDMGPDEGPCEHDYEPSSSIKRCEVLEQLHNWWFLKNGSAP